MNTVPLTAQPNWSLGLMVLVFIVCTAAFTIVASRRRLPDVARVLAKLGVVVVALLVAFGFAYQAQQGNSHALEKGMMPAPVIRASASTSPQTTVELESTKTTTELPEWARQSVRIDGNRKLVVVNSGLFASEEEAELHGFEQAAAIAVKEYASLDPRGSGTVQPQHTDLVKENAIKQKPFLEVIQYDFGKFQAPMYRLWLQVELTPELGERIAEPWRQAAVEARLRTLTGWSLWATATAALTAFALRLDAAWAGRRRAMIAGTAVVLALGSLAFWA